MTTRGIAYINHGRWLVDCPECGSPVQFYPKRRGARALCGACHPETFAVMYVPRKDGSGVLDAVPDLEKRAAAWDSNMAFIVIMPKEAERIIEILRPRHISNMNWLPGESIEDLLAENVQHGVR